MTALPAERRVHLARSSMLVMGAFLVAKVIGLLRERAIAYQFGASLELDAYVAAFRIPDLLFTLIAGGAIISAFLPVFSAALTRGDREAAWVIAGGITNLAFLATLLLALLAALAAPWLVTTVLVPDFSPAQQALTASLMRIILLSTLIFSISGLQMGILNAFQHFLLPALAPIVYNLGIVFGALFLAPWWGIYGLAVGVLLGAVLHLVIKIPGLIRYGYRYVPTLGLADPGVQRVLWLVWPRMLALGTVQIVFIVNVRLASSLAGGSLSTLNYAWVIAQMPQTILGTAVATVAFPTLAELAARGQRDALRGTAVGALTILIALTVPAAVGLWVLAGPVINLLLVTGAFDEAAASATLLTLRMFALGLLGHVALEIVARLFYAQQDTLTPLGVAAAAMVVNVVLAVVLVVSLAQAGLALANSIAVSAEVLLGLWLLGRRLDGIGGRQLTVTLFRTGLAGLAMAIAMSVTAALLPGLTAASPFWSGLVTVAVGGSVGLAVYLVAATALGVTELRDLARLLLRRSSAG